MQYVVETRFVGERRVPGAPVEVVGKETREVDGALLSVSESVVTWLFTQHVGACTLHMAELGVHCDAPTL